MESQPPKTYIKLTVYIVIFVVGFFGNLFTIIIICRKGQNKSVYQRLVLNLAITDFLFIISVLPLGTYTMFAEIKSEFYCRAVTPLLTTFYFVSIFTITSMALQRCRSILFPHRPKISKQKAYAWMTAIWVASFIMVLPLAIVTKLGNTGACEENWPSFAHRQVYTMALFLLQYLIPLIIIASVYVKITKYLLKSEVSGRARNANFATEEQRAAEARRLKSRNQAIRTLAVVVIFFAICLLPGQVAWLLMDFGNENQQKTVDIFLAFSNVLDIFHACVNPIIYCLLNARYRKEYIQCLVSLFQRNSEQN